MFNARVLEGQLGMNGREDVARRTVAREPVRNDSLSRGSTKAVREEGMIATEVWRDRGVPNHDRWIELRVGKKRVGVLQCE